MGNRRKDGREGHQNISILAIRPKASERDKKEDEKCQGRKSDQSKKIPSTRRKTSQRKANDFQFPPMTNA